MWRRGLNGILDVTGSENIASEWRIIGKRRGSLESLKAASIDGYCPYRCFRIGGHGVSVALPPGTPFRDQIYRKIVANQKS
jgi:hypothetical protein